MFEGNVLGSYRSWRVSVKLCFLTKLKTFAMSRRGGGFAFCVLLNSSEVIRLLSKMINPENMKVI